MSTRAVYEFYGKNNKRILSIYIHWDGYPDGAAVYFKNALDKTERYLEAEDDMTCGICADNFMTNFIRYNKYAEITQSSELHSDLEYIYKMDLFSRKITIHALNWDKVIKSGKCRYEMDDQSEFWDVIETYAINDFLKKYSQLIDAQGDNK